MIKKIVGKAHKQLSRDQAIGAQRDLLDQLFNDHYRNRWGVYKMNFVRGIFFGLGSVIGATIIVSLLIWVLSLLNVPKNFIQSLESSQSQNVQ